MRRVRTGKGNWYREETSQLENEKEKGDTKMAKVNDNYLKLPGSYLFSTIGKKVNA